jgi:hypothetical protein
VNVTPKTVARQIVLARAERAAKPFFTSETGVVRVTPQNIEPNVWDVDDAHCFVCSRHTDHFAEHDDLVEQGFAQYEQDGSVTWTEKGWNEFRG